MQTDIVSRLLKSAESTVLDRAAKGFKTDTATTIQAVAAAYIERLEAALEPFAKLGEQLTSDFSMKPDSWGIWGFNDVTLTYGDFRRARNTLKGGNDGQERET